MLKWWDYVIICVVISLIVAICVLIAIKYNKADQKYNKRIMNSQLGNMVNKLNGYLSEKEYTFFKVLSDVASSIGYIAFPKVEVCNIVARKSERLSNHQAFHNCVDFCLFTLSDFSPVIVVDLYDNTIGDHALEEMDSFMVRAIKNAGISIIKIDYNEGLDQNYLKSVIEEEIRNFLKNMVYKEVISE